MLIHGAGSNGGSNCDSVETVVFNDSSQQLFASSGHSSQQLFTSGHGCWSHVGHVGTLPKGLVTRRSLAAEYASSTNSATREGTWNTDILEILKSLQPTYAVFPRF